MPLKPPEPPGQAGPLWTCALTAYPLSKCKPLPQPLDLHQQPPTPTPTPSAKLPCKTSSPEPTTHLFLIKEAIPPPTHPKPSAGPAPRSHTVFPSLHAQPRPTSCSLPRSAKTGIYTTTPRLFMAYQSLEHTCSITQVPLLTSTSPPTPPITCSPSSSP